MKRIIVWCSVAMMGVACSYGATPITSYVQLNPPNGKQIGGTNVSTSTVTQLCFDNGTCMATAGGTMSGGGTVTNAGQYSIGYYSLAGTSNVIAGIAPVAAGYVLQSGGFSAPAFYGTNLNVSSVIASTLTAGSGGISAPTTGGSVVGYYFGNDNTTGIYQNTLHTVNIAANSIAVLQATPQLITTTLPIEVGNPLTSISSITINGAGGLGVAYGAILGSATLSNVTGLTQCLHADSSGHVTGSGADCGTGSGGGSGSGTVVTSPQYLIPYYSVTGSSNVVAGSALATNNANQMLSPGQSGTTTPAYAFTGDTTSGMNQQTAGQLDLDAGGLKMVNLNPIVGITVSTLAASGFISSSGNLISYGGHGVGVYNPTNTADTYFTDQGTSGQRNLVVDTDKALFSYLIAQHRVIFTDSFGDLNSSSNFTTDGSSVSVSTISVGPIYINTGSSVTYNSSGATDEMTFNSPSGYGFRFNTSNGGGSTNHYVDLSPSTLTFGQETAGPPSYESIQFCNSGTCLPIYSDPGYGIPLPGIYFLTLPNVSGATPLIVVSTGIIARGPGGMTINYGLTAATGTFNSAGNGIITQTISGSTYTTVTSSYPPTVGYFAQATSTNGTVGWVASGGGGGGTFSGINSSGNPFLTNSATLLAGNNASLSQSGSTITINAIPSSPNYSVQTDSNGVLAGTPFETVDASSISFNQISSMTFVGFSTMVFQSGTALDIQSGSVLAVEGSIFVSSLTITAGGTGITYNPSAFSWYGMGSPYQPITGNFNFGLGSNTLNPLTGSDNTAIGFNALDGGALNDNSAFGKNSLNFLSGGSGNTAYGSLSLDQLTTGSSNTAMGYGVGYGLDLSSPIISGNANTFIGYEAGVSTSATINNSIAIGYGAVVVSSNTSVIGTISNTSLKTYGHFLTNGSSPAVSSCGTSPNGSVIGDDNQGTITVGGTAPTACTLTFSKSWATTPVCVITDNSLTISGDISSLSSTQMVLGFGIGGLAGGTVYYHCGCSGPGCQ